MQSGKKFLSVASVRESINTRTDAIDIHTFCPVFGTVGTQTGEFLYRRSCLMAGRGWHVNYVNSYFYIWSLGWWEGSVECKVLGFNEILKLRAAKGEHAVSVNS
jgi:hypothetical protein